MRHTGIDLIGDVPWGTHFCPLHADEAGGALAAEVSNFDDYAASHWDNR